MTHFAKEHPNIPENITQDIEVEDQLNKTIIKVQSKAEVVPAPNSSRPVARKSTSIPAYDSVEEYSFYGSPQDETDLTKINTAVEINGMYLNMSADKLGKIFDLHPYIDVEDCSKSLDTLDSWPEWTFDFNIENFDEENLEIDILTLIEDNEYENRPTIDLVNKHN